MLGLGTVTVDGRPHALPPQEHSRVGWTGQKTQHSEREGCPGTDKGRARNGGKAGSRHPEDAVHASVSGSHPSHREGLYPRASRPKASEAHFVV